MHPYSIYPYLSLNHACSLQFFRMCIILLDELNKSGKLMWYLKENIDIGDAYINRNIIQGSKIQIIKPYGVKFKDLQTLGI